MVNKLNLVEKISLINICFFIFLMTTPIFYWKGAEIQYLVFMSIFIFTGLHITKGRITVERLTISVIIWLFFVLVYRMVNYSTATFFIYAQIIIFWLTYIVFTFSDKYLKSRTRKIIGSVGVVIFLANIIQNSIILKIYPNASRQITKASIYYDQFRDLNIGSTSFVFAASLLIFVFLGLMINARHRTIRMFYLLIAIFLVYFQFQSGRAISILLMSLGLILFAFLYFSKKIDLGSKIAVLFMLSPTVALILAFLPKIIFYFNGLITDRYLSDRLLSIATYLSNSNSSNALGSRLEVYWLSIRAFISNPIFGIGEHDQFTQKIAVGYHSEFLDIMGTYGIFGILFWVLFFWFYYKKIILRTKNKNDRIVLIVTAILFCTYALLNSVVAHDAIPVMIFLIIPFLFSSNRGVSINEFN